jgi:release factor glutamine methyltransferase
VAPETTISALLQAGTERLREAGSPSPRLDAELLLGYVLGIDRAGVLAHPNVELSPPQLDRYLEGIARRETGEPIAYIRGIKEFFGFVFVADARALIPRPETELLVEIALARLRERLVASPRPPGTPPLLVADVGTGSGAIAISLALECRRRGYAGHVRLVASDVDGAALGLARENGVGHGVADIIEFVEADLMPAGEQEFDLILANLPYIPSADVPLLPVAASFEPRSALDGGPDGLAVIARLLELLPARLAQGGLTLLEIGSDQADRLRAIAETALPVWKLAFHSDLAGQPRVAEVSRPATAPAALERAAVELRAGRVVAIPTETVYGLAVLPREAALARLIEIKGRSTDKGIALLVDSIAQVHRLARMTPVAERLAERFWPGPLTLVLPQRPDNPLPALLSGGRPTIGVRLPDHEVPRALARLLGPIAVSSANISGQPDATTAERVRATLGDVVAFVIDDGPVRGGVPSTVVTCLDDGPPQVLREGAISSMEIRAGA